MKCVAVVPVKAQTERVENNNFREFTPGLSLLEHKLIQLKNADCFLDIFVSSDSKEAEAIAKKVGVQFVLREKYLCNNVVPWSDVIFNVVKSLPVSDNTFIAWCHTTSPLFNRYSEALDVLAASINEDGLCAVERCNEFIISEYKIPVNYAWGAWHKYSQDLPKYYFVNGALFVALKSLMLKNRYVISSDPVLFECDKFESIDIDTSEDYRLAQLIASERV